MINIDTNELAQLNTVLEVIKDYTESNALFFRQKDSLQTEYFFSDETTVFGIYDPNRQIEFVINSRKDLNLPHLLQMLFSNCHTSSNIVINRNYNSKMLGNYSVHISDKQLLIRDDSLNFLEHFQDKMIKVEKIRQLVPEKAAYLFDFLNDIDNNNYDQYKAVIEKNKNKIHELLLCYKEAKKFGFDFFNMNDEEKNLLQLKTDIKYDSNENENQWKNALKRIKNAKLF